MRRVVVVVEEEQSYRGRRARRRRNRGWIMIVRRWRVVPSWSRLLRMRSFCILGRVYGALDAEGIETAWEGRWGYINDRYLLR